MTCQIRPSQIFSLYRFKKCTYCMSSCSLKRTDGRRDISSTSVFGQLIPSVHSTACGVTASLHTKEKKNTPPTPTGRCCRWFYKNKSMAADIFGSTRGDFCLYRKHDFRFLQRIKNLNYFADMIRLSQRKREKAHQLLCM